MKVEKIKPVPKYILKRIRKTDKANAKQTGNTRFYAYLTKNDGELVKVTVAVRNYHKKWVYKQVAVHGVHSDIAYVKDLAQNFLHCYLVGWFAEGISTYKKWYESGEWGWIQDKYLDPYAPIVNLEYINKFPEYKYSAYNLYKGVDIIKYLRTYEQHPITEYLLKARLQYLVFSKQIIERLEKDREFRKWVISNKQELQSNSYYVSAIIEAYKKNKPLGLIQQRQQLKYMIYHDAYYRILKLLLKRYRERILDYIISKEINVSLYNDYIKACLYLELNISLPKNLTPHNFIYWHDTRIEQAARRRKLTDEQCKQELYRQFEIVATKYLPMQWDKDSKYITVIAVTPADLIAEGEILHHCVGRSNYDIRMAEEKSLIFFIRSKDNPSKPLYTMEYSLQQRNVLQFYGDHNSKPDEEVQHYVYKQWLPYANKQLNKINKAA